MAKVPLVPVAPPQLVESIPVDSSDGGRVARILRYSDGSVRVRLYGFPEGAHMEECWLTPSQNAHVIFKVKPRRDAQIRAAVAEMREVLES